MKRHLSKLATIAALAALTLTLYAQQGPPPGPPQGGRGGEPKNLKVFPKDTPRQRLMGAMNGFTRALGVRCDHCHVQGDFASDEKSEKDVARAMMKMMASLRQNGDEFFPGGRIEKVSCWTCHRGSPKIEIPAPPQPPGQAPRPGGEQKPPEKL